MDAFVFDEQSALLEEDVERKNKRSILLPVGKKNVLFRQSLLLTETGGSLWDCSVVLNACLSCSMFNVKGLVVFELGSGIGYSACVAAEMGAKRVVATDGDVEVIRLLKENCKGFENVVVKHFPWGGTIEEADLDVVMAADVVFDESNHPALLESLSSAPRLVLVVRKRHKKVEKRFFAELGKRLALVRKIKASTLQLQLPVNATDIRVFEYARK